MSDAMSDAEWKAALIAMDKAGTRAGTAAGSYLVDGNTTEEQAETLLKQIEEGDPAAPCPPDPLSGEWADMPRLWDVIADETDCDLDSLTPDEESELGDAYEQAFYAAWYDEVERSCRAKIAD
jgi:hypothetical protein